MFALVPFGLAEVVRFLRTREIRVGVGWRFVRGDAARHFLAVVVAFARVLRSALLGAAELFEVAPMYGAFFEIRRVGVSLCCECWPWGLLARRRRL